VHWTLLAYVKIHCAYEVMASRCSDSPVSPAVDLTTLSLANGDHGYHYAVVFDLIDRSVTCATQFDLVAVYQA